MRHQINAAHYLDYFKFLDNNENESNFIRVLKDSKMIALVASLLE